MSTKTLDDLTTKELLAFAVRQYIAESLPKFDAEDVNDCTSAFLAVMDDTLVTIQARPKPLPKSVLEHRARRARTF